MNTKRQLRGIANIKSFAKAACVMAGLGSVICVIVTGATRLDDMPYALMMCLGATLFMVLITGIICILADIATALISSPSPASDLTSGSSSESHLASRSESATSVPPTNSRSLRSR